MSVMFCTELGPAPLQSLLSRYGLELVWIANDSPVPGSFWGDSEAGLIANRLYVRDDTPVHSALHEACHYICLDEARRSGLHTDAGGDYDEENAVCYLQILLAAHLPPLNSERLMADMNSWGYSFRLGSAEAWFTQDAQDAHAWLRQRGLIDLNDQPTWRLRT